MSAAAIEINPQRERIDELLAAYRGVIGTDFDGYRNHVYRTVTYAMHFLEHDTAAERAVETAMAYHDIGLWTDQELAYLEPSEAVAVADNEKYEWGLDPELLTGIIHWHHKILPYKGPHSRIIEACRRADWVDASMGWLKKGLRRADIRAVEAAFPNCGFPRTLLRLTKAYSGSTILGSLRVTRGIVKL